jgi:hypothetical protein
MGKTLDVAWEDGNKLRLIRPPSFESDLYSKLEARTAVFSADWQGAVRKPRVLIALGGHSSTGKMGISVAPNSAGGAKLVYD